VPAGAQTLVVTCTGLDALEQRVSLTAGETLAQDLALTSAVYVLDALTVKTMREGQSLAIQQQRQAPNIKLVTAIDAFGNPAANPGELIQRLAEVSTEIIGSEVRGVFIRGMAPSFSVLQVDGQQTASSRGTGASREFQIEQQDTGNIRRSN
jgi:outer membrane receptor for ferrienterochelin and colicin